MNGKNSDRYSSSIRDLLIISTASVFLFLAEYNFKAFELLEGWLQKKYGWDTNEFIRAFIIVAAGFAVFSLRRWREFKAAIVERKQSEYTLIESEERYRSLVNLSPDAIFIQSEGKFAFINPAGVKLFGATSAEELIGKPVLELMHSDFRGIVNERIQILKEEKAEVPVLEEKYLRLDGSSVDVEVAATPFIYQGKPGAQVIARDITQRRKMEDILKKERDKAQLYLDIAGVMLVAIDAEQRITLINKKGCEILGYCEEDILGKNWFDNFVPERIRDEVKVVFDKMMRGEIEPIEHYENPVLTKSGEEKLISWHNALIADENGIISGTLSSGEDITGRRKAEEFVRNILENVDEGFIVIDHEYRILSANKSYLKMVDIPVEDVIGKHCYEISHHIYKPCCEAGQDCPVKDTFKTGNPGTAVHTHYDKEGNPVFVEIKSYPVKNESGEVVSAIEVINNITEKKKLEDQLRHSQKLEAIGTFAGGIAHDFNNILTAIIGYGNLLQMKMQADEPLRAYVDPILISAERAASLTQSLLAFSRKQIMNPRPVNLNEIIGVVKKLMVRLIGEDIEVKTLFSEDDLTIMADPGQIEQVIINLATNARDAMQEGGALTIITKAVELDNEFIMAHNYGKKGKYAFVSVTDTGTGMDESTKEKIFDPFFTTKEVGKGTGLGLAIVYGIIKQHNGYINVYSEQGQGTTFNIYLPLTHKAEVKETKLAEIAPSMEGAETVLLAEDEEEVRQITKTVLEKFGYKVIEAVDGEDAVNKFVENRDKIELLIFDVIMPKKTGKEAYKEIKKIRPDIRALFTSGYPAEISDGKGLFEEGINFVPKPVSPTEFLKKVREILDKKRVDSIP
ncbi:MAG: PAS domain S-box protein [Nitrospirae bacterium]|nr:PAS domain S-box protein [Nitrospirota bacterium]